MALGSRIAKRAKRQRFEVDALPHLDALYFMALRLTNDERDAEDLVQDALVRAFRFFDRFEEGSNIKAWLFKILTNTFYNNVRKRKNIRKLEEEAESGWHFERFVSTATTSAAEAESRVLDAIGADEIQQAIAELPLDFRTVVILCDIQGFSYKEIAEIVDCPVGTVMSRLFRARRQLQRKLFEQAVDRGVIAPGAAEPTDLAAFRERKRRGGA